MDELVNDLKAQARILHTQVKNNDPAAIKRVRSLSELRKADDETLVTTTKRRHCLSVIACELGFEGWQHAVASLAGDPTTSFGTLLYPDGAAAHFNIWSANYEEARTIRQEHGGYLLAYKRHFFIVDRHFIETLGLDPDDADWERIGRDWVQPVEPKARSRLTAKLIRLRLEAKGFQSTACG